MTVKLSTDFQAKLSTDFKAKLSSPYITHFSIHASESPRALAKSQMASRTPEILIQ